MKFWTSMLALVGIGLWGSGALAQEAAPVTDEKAEEAPEKQEWEKTDKERRAEEEPEEVVTETPLDEVEDLIERTMGRVKGEIAKSDFPALETERRRRQVRELSTVPHPKTLSALKKIFQGKYEPEVRGAAAWALGHMKFERDKTAKYLCSRIKREWKNPAVLIGIAQGLGELRRSPDQKAMYSYFNHPDDGVYCSMIECLGCIGHREHLSKLHEIFSQYAKKSTSGVNVRVDTGTAGPGDQNAATAKGRGMMKKAKVVRRAGALHATQMAVKAITGIKFEVSNEMFDWMKEREKELGIELR